MVYGLGPRFWGAGARFEASAGGVFFAPMAEGFEDGAEGLAVGGEGVFHLGWDLVIDFAGDDAIGLEFAQLLGEHFLRGIGHELAQLAKAAGLQQEVTGDDGLPLSADHGESGAHGTFFGFHRIKKDTTAQNSAYLWENP